MQGFKQYIESITEKWALKTVYTAGSAGSGKSYISSHMFSRINFRDVDIDRVTELFKRKGLTINRDRAWELVDKQLSVWLRDFDPLLIDGTGRIYNTITNQSNSLRNIGYDTYMVFINVDKDVAWQRNAARSRVVPKNVFDQIYASVYENLEKYKQYFGNDLIILDNTSPIDVYRNSAKLKQMAVQLISRPNPGSKRQHVLARASKTNFYPIATDPNTGSRYVNI